MAMLARDVQAWLNSIPPDWTVAVDESGLTLVAVGPSKRYHVELELGGKPKEVTNEE